MLDRLDRITDRTAYMLVGLGVGVSLLAAFLAPQDVELGAWVRLVIWHGMLTTACVLGIITMGAIAAAYLASGRERLYSWSRALQFTLLPAWVLAALVGAISARLVWNSWNLTERRMLVSVAYIVVAAVALMAGLLIEDRRAGAIGQVVSALAMAAGLAWIALGPAGEDIHPTSAVLSSPDVAFKLAALVMVVGSLLAVFGLTLLVRRWLLSIETGELGPDDLKASTEAAA